MEMREDMPPKHLAFIVAVKAGPSVRDFVERINRASTTALLNQCLEILGDLRSDAS